MVAHRRTIHYIESEIATMSMSESLLGSMPTTVDLPDYETAVKKFSPPPPSYAIATAMAQENINGQISQPAEPVASEGISVEVVSPTASDIEHATSTSATSPSATSDTVARNV